MTDLPSILDLLDLERVEPDLYRSRALYDAPWGMFGGQAAAQALYAAGLTVDTGRLPHSLHGYFVRRETARSRRCSRWTGTGTGARSPPAGWWPCRTAGSSSACRPRSPRRPRHDGRCPTRRRSRSPDLPPPDSLPSWDNPKHPSFEFRPVDRERRLPSHFWLRCTTELPDDPLLHAAVLAYTSDISTALIPFETRESSTGPSLDHAVWFHRPARMDGWHWQELTPRTVAGGRGWYTVSIYTPDGHAVASVAQEQLFATRRSE